MMRRITAVSLAVALACALLAPTAARAGGAPEIQEAPLSPEFLKWLEEREAEAQGPTEVRAAGARPGVHPTGHIPSPIDRSHLTGRPRSLERAKASRAPVVAALESAYNTDRSKNTTSAKDQGSYGTCWAHAAMAGCESNALARGLGTFDLSELHLAWFTYKGEAGKIFSSTDGRILRGGNADKAVAFMSRMAGPTLEANLPYSSAISETSVNGVKDSPEDPQYPLALRLREAYELGDVTPANRANVKALIKEHGAVHASFYCDQTTTTSGIDDARGYFAGTGDKFCYYKDTNSDSNHAVVLVGWDDTFSKEDFGQDRPTADGAWLVKNSWGDDWGNEGYFYMSYEQKISGATVYIVEAAPSSALKKYEHDILGKINRTGYGSYSNVAWAANVFRAEGDEILKEIGFHTTGEDVAWEISVYDLGTEEPTSPVPTSEPLDKATGTSPYAGYHTVAMSAGARLTEGHWFSVVVKFTDPDEVDKSFPIPTEERVTFRNGDLYADPIIDGKSWISPDGTNWNKMIDSDVCIKAFTMPDLYLTIDDAGPFTGKVGTDVSIPLTATKSDPSKMTGAIVWSSTDLPGGLTLDAATGKIEGKPTAAGTHDFTVTATCGSWSDTRNFSITISAADDAPVISTATLTNGKVGELYRAALKTTGGTGAITWELASGSLGDLSLSSAGVISGTPRTEGMLTFTVKATDGLGRTATKAMTIVIEPEGALAISTEALTKGVVGELYRAALKATGGTGAITWELASGSLGDLSLSSAGVISGTPRTEGMLTFTVKATDGLGRTATKAMTIVIEPEGAPVDPDPDPDPDPTPPVEPTPPVDPVIVEPIKIVTEGLSGGTVGAPYWARLWSDGAVVAWSISSGALPAGLTLAWDTGVISGTPTVAGRYEFTVMATTSETSVTRTLAITIAPAEGSGGGTSGGVAVGDIVSGGDGRSFVLIEIPVRGRTIFWLRIDLSRPSRASVLAAAEGWGVFGPYSGEVVSGKLRIDVDALTPVTYGDPKAPRSIPAGTYQIFWREPTGDDAKDLTPPTDDEWRTATAELQLAGTSDSESGKGGSSGGCSMGFGALALSVLALAALKRK